jgi:hypothetical protein
MEYLDLFSISLSLNIKKPYNDILTAPYEFNDEEVTAAIPQYDLRALLRQESLSISKIKGFFKTSCSCPISSKKNLYPFPHI